MDLLRSNFVTGWTNIKGKRSYAGTSNTHLPSYSAMTVYNCSGHHNVQMFFMTSDGKVLHCLPGFWAPEHFLHEARFAVELGKLYYKKDKVSPVKLNELYLDAHLTHAFTHDPRLRRASRHQGFDRMNLEKRSETDFRREKGFVTEELKTPDQVMHERLAAMPFTPFEKFDVAAYIDMGRKKYKYDYGVPGKGHARGKTTTAKRAGRRSPAGRKTGRT